MAYLSEICQPKCADCRRKPASYELRNRRNGLVRHVCKGCSRRALASLKETERRLNRIYSAAAAQQRPVRLAAISGSPSVS